VRDWVPRFNSSGPTGLVDRKAPGKAALLTGEHGSALAQAVAAGPVPWRDGVVRWRLVDLAGWLRDEFGITASRQTVSHDGRHRSEAVANARAPADGLPQPLGAPAGARSGPGGDRGV
jgi:Homeodomain-like domain